LAGFFLPLEKSKIRIGYSKYQKNELNLEKIPNLPTLNPSQYTTKDEKTTRHEFENHKRY